MQFTKATLIAVLASLASAQTGNIASDLAAIPACALTCLATAVGASGCSALDYYCQCTAGQPAILASTAPCILTGCSTADAAKASTLYDDMCKVALAAGPAQSSALASASSSIARGTSPVLTYASSVAVGASSRATSAGSAAATATRVATTAATSAATSAGASVSSAVSRVSSGISSAVSAASSSNSRGTANGNVGTTSSVSGGETTAAVTAPGNVSQQSSSPSPTPTGTIVGGAVGGFVALVVIIGLIFFIRRRKRRAAQSPPAAFINYSDSAPPAPMMRDAGPSELSPDVAVSPIKSSYHSLPLAPVVGAYDRRSHQSRVPDSPTWNQAVPDHDTGAYEAPANERAYEMPENQNMRMQQSRGYGHQYGVNNTCPPVYSEGAGAHEMPGAGTTGGYGHNNAVFEVDGGYRG